MVTLITSPSYPLLLWFSPVLANPTHNMFPMWISIFRIGGYSHLGTPFLDEARDQLLVPTRKTRGTNLTNLKHGQ